MHLGHVCTPGAAGIARAMPGEVVKSAPTIRLVTFHVVRTSQGGGGLCGIVAVCAPLSAISMLMRRAIMKWMTCGGVAQG